MNKSDEMMLRHGVAWHEKVVNHVFAVWATLPWYKRVYWTLRGKSPNRIREA